MAKNLEAFAESAGEEEDDDEAIDLVAEMPS